jgi:hypothetical protein
MVRLLTYVLAALCLFAVVVANKTMPRRKKKSVAGTANYQKGQVKRARQFRRDVGDDDFESDCDVGTWKSDEDSDSETDEVALAKEWRSIIRPDYGLDLEPVKSSGIGSRGVALIRSR